jgi:hypothetical protein
MVLTWVFAVCLLNAQGECRAYIPQSNFAYLPLEQAHDKCTDLLKMMGGGNRKSGQINVCVKAYQYDETLGAYK